MPGMVEGRARTQPADVRREQLLDAAQQVLVARGLRATTVADVAAAAGVAKGTTYLYFASKDELLAGLRARYVERFAAALDERPRGTAVERIRHLVVALFAFAWEHHELHHVLFHEAGFSENDAFTGMRERLTTLIAQGVKARELDVDDPPLAASYVLHGVHGALVETLHGSHRRSGQGRRRRADAVVDLTVRMLAG
jgi:AcrR family transcriptional regulator